MKYFLSPRRDGDTGVSGVWSNCNEDQVMSASGISIRWWWWWVSTLRGGRDRGGYFHCMVKFSASLFKEPPRYHVPQQYNPVKCKYKQ